MKVVLDISEPVFDWVTFLTDVSGGHAFDLTASILSYNIMDDVPFLDDFAEEFYRDDILVYIQKTSGKMLRDKLDAFLEKLGYMIVKIVSVVCGTRGGKTVYAVMDVSPIGGYR